jgi:hypothetical protein
MAQMTDLDTVNLAEEPDDKRIEFSLVLDTMSGLSVNFELF